MNARIDDRCCLENGEMLKFIRIKGPREAWPLGFHKKNCPGDDNTSGFSLGRLHMGGFVPPIWGQTSAGDKVLMGGGGTHEGDTDLMGGPNSDRLYHKLKVLLMLSCNYTMQFIGYDSIKTR